MSERHYMALMRSKAAHSHRQQELVMVAFYSEPAPTAHDVAKMLVNRAQLQFRCDAKYLIVDRVL